jgi:hypothetical protein
MNLSTLSELAVGCDLWCTYRFAASSEFVNLTFDSSYLSQCSVLFIVFLNVNYLDILKIKCLNDSFKTTGRNYTLLLQHWSDNVAKHF